MAPTARLSLLKSSPQVFSYFRLQTSIFMFKIRQNPTYKKKKRKNPSLSLYLLTPSSHSTDHISTPTFSFSMTLYRLCLCSGHGHEAASGDPAEAVKDVFFRYSGNDGLVGPSGLQRFLVEVQGEAEATRETALQIMDSLRVDQFKRITLDAFFRYLAGDDNQPLNPSLGVHQDMNAPLSHYYIYTGHNSYLTGNQLSSESSDVPIIKALHRGVRVIELDLWPNSLKTDVEVRHGRTLTTPVEFSKCLKSIKEHAFVASPYPVIITLEDHLTSNLQAKVAEMLKETFKDLLFYPTTEVLDEFPSPEDLKFRILISTKPPKEVLGSKSMKENGNELQNGTKEEKGAEVPYPEADGSAEYRVELDNCKVYQKEEDHDADDQFPHQPIAHEYKHLISIYSRKGKELKNSLKGNIHKVTRLSLSEQLFEKAVNSRGAELIRFTRKNILRIYPKGIRITSSNYNPLLGWMHGAQMVALNMQGYGRSLWLMHGFFRANGGCGYVKKPDFLLESDTHSEVFDPLATLPVKKILKVKIYLGDVWRAIFKKTNFSIYSQPVFYTKVEIVGVPADTVSKKTKKIEDWTPVWNEEFSFGLSVPELALLRIKVHKYNTREKDGFGGQTCLPVSELRPGIRAVPLYDRKGNRLKSVKLLMHFQFV